jgi:hypothetical protein
VTAAVLRAIAKICGLRHRLGVPLCGRPSCRREEFLSVRLSKTVVGAGKASP